MYIHTHRRIDSMYAHTFVDIDKAPVLNTHLLQSYKVTSTSTNTVE